MRVLFFFSNQGRDVFFGLASAHASDNCKDIVSLLKEVLRRRSMNNV
jgi:hypothetical protein